MKPEIIRVEPYSTWLENWKAPTSAVSRANGFVFVSGMPWYNKIHRTGFTINLKVLLAGV